MIAETRTLTENQVDSHSGADCLRTEIVSFCQETVFFLTVLLMQEFSAVPEDRILF